MKRLNFFLVMVVMLSPLSVHAVLPSIVERLAGVMLTCAAGCTTQRFYKSPTHEPFNPKELFEELCDDTFVMQQNNREFEIASADEPGVHHSKKFYQSDKINNEENPENETLIARRVLVSKYIQLYSSCSSISPDKFIFYTNQLNEELKRLNPSQNFISELDEIRNNRRQ